MNLRNARVHTSDQLFKLQGAFYDVVPIDDDVSQEHAKSLNSKVSQAIGSRIETFCKLLNLTARQDSLRPWQEIDIALTALAVILEEGGLDGALEVIRPAVEREANLSRGDGPGH